MRLPVLLVTSNHRFTNIYLLFPIPYPLFPKLDLVLVDVEAG